MRLFWALTIALFLPFFGGSQNVSVTGNASFYASEKIEVFKFQNRLTNQKEFISSVKIGPDGTYMLQINLNEPQVIIFKIEMREILIHIHPNCTLVLDFLPIKNADNQRLPMIYELSYSHIPDGMATDSVYQDLQDSFAELQSEIRIKSVVDQFYLPFFTKADSTYKPYIETDSLFAVYYTYFKANALLLTRISRTKLIQKFISNKPIQYQSKEYLKFITATLNPRINQLFMSNHTELEAGVKEYKIYDSLLKLLEIDSTLEMDELRSLALLNYVRTNSSNRMLKKEQKIAIIGQIANFCPYPVQKQTAQWYRKKKRALQKNTEAPIFELEDQYGQKLSLQKLRGKPVYLGFMKSTSRACYTDLLVIEQLRKKYKKAEFFIVLTDRDSVDMSKLPDEASNFNYVFLSKKYSILETYEIWSYPVYFLLDKHGYFMESPANRPEEMYSVFEKMFAKKSRRKRYEIIND